MSEYVKIPAFIMRGGTSKGVYLMLKDLPVDPVVREKVILNIYGSPDVRQISGLGGADPLTSKVAIISPSNRDGVDVDYTFGYVGINEASIDYAGNCGNISAGVGPFAILKGIVPVTEPVTRVRIFNTNTEKVIEAEIPVRAGDLITEGDYFIDGVPGTGAKIALNFLNSGGSKTGKLLPTGHVVDTMTIIDGRKIKVSIVDAANPAVFVKAEDIGLTGRELPQDTETNPAIIEIMEDIRTTAAVMIGLATTKSQAGPSLPKVAFVAPPQDYATTTGQLIKADAVNFLARTRALAVMHKAYAVTGGICVSTAALIEGTVVNEVADLSRRADGRIKIGHPSGVTEFFVEVEKKHDGQWILRKSGVNSTARPIMEGDVYVSMKSFYADKSV